MPKKDANETVEEATLKVNSKLSSEERKARASAAAKAMWEKRRAAKLSASAEPSDAKPPEPPAHVEAQPVSETQVQGKRATAPPVPKEFSRALAAAEKDYAKSLEQLLFHEEMAAMLRARIPFLTQAIRALGGNAAGSAEIPGAVALRANGPEINYPPPENLPAVPVARGGSMGVINDAKTAEDENQFLRDAEGVGAGGGWQ